MTKTSATSLAAGAVMVALLSACGGGGGSAAPVAEVPSAPVVNIDIGQSVTALLDYVARLITETSDTSEPIAVTSLTLAADDTAEPSPVK